MPLTDRTQAKDSGFAQVRAALVRFEGDVVSAEFDTWGGKLIDNDGKPIPPREFLEISCINVKVLETTEELSVPIDEWSFRINCSMSNGSFWVDDFLLSTDNAAIIVPDGLVGKRIEWVKFLHVADKPQYNSTNFIVSKVLGECEVPEQAITPAPTPPAPPTPQPSAPSAIDSALNLAIGKTEEEFRVAIGNDPAFATNPLLPLAKSGAVTQSFVTDGKLILDSDGKYQKP